MSNAKKNAKNQGKPTQEELAASLQALLAQGKRGHDPLRRSERSA